jgi:cytochrome c oxidase assembly factor CtaG
MARLFVPLTGLIAWTVQFTIIYGATSLVCARGYGDMSRLGIGIIPLTIVATTLLALAATGFVLFRAVVAKRRMDAATPATERFLNDTTLMVSSLSLVTISWHGIPAIIVPACS